MGNRGKIVGIAFAVFFGLISGASVSAHAGGRAHASQTLLITGFEPFGGRVRNNSYEIAKRLKADRSLLGEDVAVEICELPVVYDRAASVAQECYEKLRAVPDFVVSLGEGGCTIHLETAATNLDDTPEADNAGVLRQNHVIDPSLPPRIGLTLAVDRSYCDRPAGQAEVVPSISPGAYVCNNTAFLLAHYFRGKEVPYGFIHVPPESCGGRLKPVTVKLIAQLLKSLIGPQAAAPEPWPTDLDSAQALLTKLQGENAPACDLSFVQSLESLYAPVLHSTP